jgi:hypothetical protein
MLPYYVYHVLFGIHAIQFFFVVYVVRCVESSLECSFRDLLMNLCKFVRVCAHVINHLLRVAFIWNCSIFPAGLLWLQDGTIVALRSPLAVHGSSIEGIQPGAERYGSAFVVNKLLRANAYNIASNPAHPRMENGVLPWVAKVAREYA